MKRICCVRLFSNSVVIPPDYYMINKTIAVMKKEYNEIMEIKLFIIVATRPRRCF